MIRKLPGLVNRSLKFIFLILLVISGYLFLPQKVFAQVSPSLSALAVNVEVEGDVSPGDIISVTKDGFRRSDTEYDVLMYGVLVASPVISVAPKTSSTAAVVSSGEVLIKVSTRNGEIKEGDLITSSTEAGVGMKATKGGYVVARALEPYNSSEIGVISAIVNIGYSGVSPGAGAPFIGLFTDPKNARYVLAAIVAILVVILSSTALIKLITTGVSAIGRNPLARLIINRSMIIWATVIAILAIAGAAGVVAIITLGR